MKILLTLFLAVMSSAPIMERQAEYPYENPNAQKALEEGLRFVNIYFDPSTYIVEDHTTEIFEGVYGGYLEEKTLIDILKRESRFLSKEKVSPSPFLRCLHDVQLKERPRYEYVLEVSPPFKGLIAACLRLKDNHSAFARGDITVTMFLFRYDETNGEIIQLQNIALTVD